MGYQIFDKWADAYDDHTAAEESFPFLGYRALLTALVETAEIRPGMTTLDVGIGTGAVAFLMEKLGGTVSGIDFSPKMLAKAREKLPRARLVQADVSTGNLGELDHEKFDRITSTYCLHHFTPDQQADIIYQWRLQNLNDHGLILIGDIGFATREEFDQARETYRDGWEDDEFYLCGSEMVELLRLRGVTATYQQTTICAGVLVIKKEI